MCFAVQTGTCAFLNANFLVASPVCNSTVVDLFNSELALLYTAGEQEGPLRAHKMHHACCSCIDCNQWCADPPTISGAQAHLLSGAQAIST